MEIPLSLVLPLLAILLLALLVTGPGMWSEKWGWWWLRRRRGGEDGKPGATAEPKRPVTAPGYKRR